MEAAGLLGSAFQVSNTPADAVCVNESNGLDEELIFGIIVVIGAALLFLFVSLSGADDMLKPASERNAESCKEAPYASSCGGLRDDDGNGIDDAVDAEYGRYGGYTDADANGIDDSVDAADYGTAP